MFPEWVSALDVADTGERSGLSQSLWGPDARSEGPVDLGSEPEMVPNDVPLLRHTHSAKKYASMLRLHSGMPCAPVTSGAERRKFATEVYAKLFVQGDQMGRVQSHQRINFDKWAVEWNEHCAKIETGLAESEAVYRKTSQQLENHYEKFKGFANANNTMNLLRQRGAALRSGLREAEGGASFAGLVGSVVPPPVPRSRSGAGIGVCGGTEGGGAAGGAGVSAGVAEMLDFSGGGGQFDAPQPKPKKPKGPPRGPQLCFTAATGDKKARIRRRTLPRVGGGSGPSAMCRQKSTGPRSLELGKLEQTESGRGRGVIVKSAQ